MIHSIYKTIGHIYCKFQLLLFDIRDRIFPPEESAILIVAHPDDETLFFYSYIKKNKPYIVVLTTGWSIIRMRSFTRAMKAYGVKYRIYDMQTNDRNEIRLMRRILHVLRLGDFKEVLTHNLDGEYGHEMHKRIHKCVVRCAKIPVYCPSTKEKLIDNRLEDNMICQKEDFITKYYKSEIFVLKEYRIWVDHECLERKDI